MFELVALILVAGFVIGTFSYFASKSESEETVEEVLDTRSEVAKARARVNGKFKGDDPSTTDVNEAWKEGHKPRTRRPK